MSASFARRSLLPLTLLYAAGVRLKNAAYDHRLLQPARLGWPVISVGNLNVGGAGKTSLVLLLARLLAERGFAVDVLSRGYGRLTKNVMRVDVHGTPAEFGDEPLLMARRGIPVFVGGERFQAGVLAEQDTSHAPGERGGLHLLDDGFQHRKLARTIDIVLLRRADLTGDMLPVGRLREPLSALERADICVLRAEDAELKDRVLQLMRTENPARIWQVERRTVLTGNLPPRAFAFCALGEPQGFFHGLRAAGVDLQGTLAFRDHHVFNQQDIKRIEVAARSSRAECYVTTEKDSIRLDAALRDILQARLPLSVAGLEVSLCQEPDAMTLLENLLVKRLQLSHGGVR